ncbi:unnamed protein product [Rotaria socialis]
MDNTTKIRLNIIPVRAEIVTIMNSMAFDSLVDSVNETGFSNDRVDIIKTTISAAGIVSPSQVAQLLDLIQFSDGKLEVAKWAFDYIHYYDRALYPSVVGKALPFSDAKAELNEHIRRY